MVVYHYGNGPWTVSQLVRTDLIVFFEQAGKTLRFPVEIVREYDPEMVRSDLLPFQAGRIFPPAEKLPPQIGQCEKKDNDQKISHI
jgi:hypothetical protein